MAHGLLLLDVDGPLNPYAAKRTRRPDGYETYCRTRHGGWHAGRDARRFRGLRLPKLPVVEFPDYDHGWKWRGVAEFAAGRPLAWFDDEHDEHAGAEDFTRLRAGTPTMLHHVDPRQGLGSAHMAAVRAWARRVRGRRQPT